MTATLMVDIVAYIVDVSKLLLVSSLAFECFFEQSQLTQYIMFALFFESNPPILAIKLADEYVYEPWLMP